MKTIIKMIMCALLVTSLSAGAALAQTDPRALVEQKVNEVMAMLDEANRANLSEAQKIAKLEGMIYDLFDMTEMSKRALGVNYNKFSEGQKQEFETLFGDMLEGIYLGNIVSAYKDQRVVFGKTVTLKENEAVEIQTEIVFADGKKTPIAYRLSNKSGQWLVYDVIIEGISFIKNYRDQFKDILSKSSPDDLLNRMRQKTTN